MFVIIVILLLIMLAMPRYMKTQKEAKVAVVTSLKGRLITAVDTIATAANLSSRFKKGEDGENYIQYDVNNSYLVQGVVLDPTEVCRILGITDKELFIGKEVISADGYYTCKNETPLQTSIWVNQLSSVDCFLTYSISIEYDSSMQPHTNLSGECAITEGDFW